MTSQRNFNLRIFERSLDVLRSFLIKYSKMCEVWLPGEVIQLQSTMVKPRICDWWSKDLQMTLHNNFKLNCSNMIWSKVKVFFVSICCDLINLAARGNHLVKNWSS